MEYISTQEIQKELKQFYSKPEQTNKTIKATENFLLINLISLEKEIPKENISTFDFFINRGLSDFAVFQDPNYLLGLTNYLLINGNEELDIKIKKRKNKETISKKYFYNNTYINTNPEYKKIDQNLIESENTPNINKKIDKNSIITEKGIEKINQIMSYINNYYKIYKPSLLRFLVNRIKENHPNVIDMEKGEIRINTDKALNHTKIFTDFMGELLLINQEHGEYKNIDFVRSSVYGGYTLIFYLLSHLLQENNFMNRNKVFDSFWSKINHGHRTKDEIINTIEDPIGLSDNIYRECKIFEGNNIPEYRMIGNTKTTNSVVKKLLGNRNYSIVSAIGDLSRATKISANNPADLMKIMAHDIENFKQQGLKIIKIKDKSMLDDMMNSGVNISKNTEKLLREKSYNNKKDRTSDFYKEVKIILEDADGNKFELKYMTEENYKKSKQDENASEYIYKYFDQIEHKNRREKILTKEYLINFWSKKIQKDKEGADNIIKIIYGKYNEENIKSFLDKIANRMNDLYKAVIIGGKVGYIYKGEKKELEGHQYFPETIDISADKKYKIYPHDIMVKINQSK